MNKTKVVNVRFSEEEVNKLKELAEREDRSLSSVVRLLSLKNLEFKKENVIDMTSVSDMRVEYITNVNTEEEYETLGCNNGNYNGKWEIHLSDGTIRTISGVCRCGNGCSDTIRLPGIGCNFKEWQRSIK